MPRYAAATAVSPDRSRAAIEALLRQHGAAEFAYGWDLTHDRMQFRLNDRVIRFLLPKPDPSQGTRTAKGRIRRGAAVEKAKAALERQRWRALLLVIRAKLEAVEAGIAVFDQEFLAFIVTGNGQTVGDLVVPRLGGDLRYLEAPKR